MCANECASEFICVSCALFWIFLLVLHNFGVLVFTLSYLIFLYYYILDACWFVRRERKGKFMDLYAWTLLFENENFLTPPFLI